jgi:hypothetical protein
MTVKIPYNAAIGRVLRRHRRAEAQNALRRVAIARNAGWVAGVLQEPRISTKNGTVRAGIEVALNMAWKVRFAGASKM